MEKLFNDSIPNNGKNNGSTQYVKVVTLNNLQNKPFLKLAPQQSQKNQSKEVILKSSGSNGKPILLTGQTDNIQNNRIMLRVPINNSDVFKVVPVPKANEETREIEKKYHHIQAPKANVGSVVLNQEQLKNLFANSANFRNNTAATNPIILHKEQLKHVFNNSTVQINGNPSKNVVVSKQLSIQGPAPKLTNISQPPIKAVIVNQQSTANSGTSNSVKILIKPPQSISTSNVEVTQNDPTRNSSSESMKTLNMSTNHHKIVKIGSNSSPHPSKNDSDAKQVKKIETSINLSKPPVKTIKLNQHIEKSMQKIDASHNLTKTLKTQTNQRFVLSPSDKFHITELTNGKKIATRIINTKLGTDDFKAPTKSTSEQTHTSNKTPNTLKHNKTPSENLNIESHVRTESTKNDSDHSKEIKSSAPLEEKSRLVFESIKIPVGSKKMYTRRPKTPDHVYKKFNLSVRKPSELIGSNKHVSKSPNKESQSSTPEMDRNTESLENIRKVQTRKVHKNENVIHGSPQKMSHKQTIVAEMDTFKKNTSLENSISTSVLLQTLKSKFVPLVGHACTATIVEHLNLAYARCRGSHGKAIKELIHYVDNYERYRDRKLKESERLAKNKMEISTQTEDLIILNVDSQETSGSQSYQPKNMECNQNRKNAANCFSPRPAISSDEVDILKLQLFKDWHTATCADVTGNMPVHNAVLENDLCAVKRHCLILKHFNNINIQNESHEMTPLHLAIYSEADMQIIEHLLENGARPEIIDVNGNNCLHLIAQHGNVEVMGLILTKYGRNVNLDTSNYNGSTALMLCAEFNKVDIARLLLQHKADPEVQDLKSGRTVLFQAIEANNESMVDLLIECGADPKKRDYSGITPLEVISEIRISAGIRKIMYKILSQNIVNLQRKRQRYFLDPDLENDVLTSSTKVRRTKDDDEL